MPLRRKAYPKNSATIQQATQETAAYTAALPSDQQDMTLHPDQTCIGHPQPLPCSNLISLASGSESSESEKQNCTATTSAAARLGLKPKSTLSITSLKSTIGTYSHGRIQWLHEDGVSSNDQINNSLGTAKRSKPKLDLVIPGGTQGRRPPAKPFVDPGNPQMRSEPVEQESFPDVSPPSGGNNISLRGSVVSPLTKALPTALCRFQRSIEAKIPRAYPQTYRHLRTASKASTSSSERRASNASSIYSNQSFNTSPGTEGTPTDPMTIEQLTANPNIQHPIVAEALDASPVSFARFEYANTNSEHHEPSVSPLRRYKHHPPIKHDREFRPTCKIPPARLYVNMTKHNQSSKQSSRRSSLAPNSSIGLINQTISGPTPRLLPDPPIDPSPTLSEAEKNLRKQLDSLAEDPIPNKVADSIARQPNSPMDDGSLRGIYGTQPADKPLESSEINTTRERQDSIQQHMPIIYSDVLPSPPLPRRSSKRRSLPNAMKFPLSHGSKKNITSQLSRSYFDGMKNVDDSVPSLAQITPTVVNRVITPNTAEDIILKILQNLSHFNDLFATATINSGFYRVFKRHELDLIRSTLWKMSPPAWEYRQVAFPGHDILHDEALEMSRPQEDYTPSAYVRIHACDVSTVQAIKLLIQERCLAFLRPDILIALRSPNSADSARVDDALWRIWTFCKLFGSGKNREEDIVAQMDWLRGGLLVHQPACTFSITSTDYMNDTLASAPEHFAKGNEGGLTAEQLFDMMELWNCLGVLLQGFEGHTAQAREYGIYDNTDIRGGDIDGEDMMLDEWCYYLLTLGLSTVLDLAGPHLLPNASAFAIASQNGWTTWKPPVPGSTRRNFLKEAASRVYEDKIAHIYAESSSREVQREISKARIQKYITELQQRKNSGELIPMIGMSQERPMSECDTVINSLTRLQPTMVAGNDLVSHIPSLRSAASNFPIIQNLHTNIAELPVASTPPPSSPLRRTVAQPLLPTPTSSTVPSIRDRSSISTILTPINEYCTDGGYREVRPLPSVSNHPVSRTNDALILPQRHLRNGSDAATFSQASRNESSLAAFGHPHTRINTHVRTFSQPNLQKDSDVPVTHFSRPTIYTNNNLPPYTQPHACIHCNLPVLSQQHDCNQSVFPQTVTHNHTHNHSSTSHIPGSSTQGSPGSTEHPAFRHYQAQQNIYHNESHIDSAGKAIHRIVEMGFTADQAREALRITDMGDGLRVDRAVELLLQRAL